ncbi:MAG: hypothetical protein JXB49_25375 [Bacteroidales bacterium]|nr:hypothetical protein [Bacteroidales bacterium]
MDYVKQWLKDNQEFNGGRYVKQHQNIKGAAAQRQANYDEWSIKKQIFERIVENGFSSNEQLQSVLREAIRSTEF